MSMNRQTKRMMAKQGPTSRPAVRAASGRARRRPKRDEGRPREYFWRGQGRAAQGRVADRQEVINSTIIVLIAVIVMTALIFGFDYVSSKFVLFLFD